MVEFLPIFQKYPVCTLLATGSCTFWLVSSILLRWPELLHGKNKHRLLNTKDKGDATIDPHKKFHSHIIAHRGSRLEGLPENSIAAFHDAAVSGADIVELDVWLSRDGHVVVHHDESFDRMTAGVCDGLIHQTHFHAFPDLTPHESQKDRCHLYPDDHVYKIPLLADVLKAIPIEVGVIIEFKQDSNELIEKVYDIVLKTHPQRINNIFWFSLHEPINTKLKEFNRSIPRITSVIGMLKVLMLYYFGLLPFLPIDVQVFGIPVDEITLDRIRREHALEAVPDWIKQILAAIFGGRPSKMMVSPTLFAHLRKRGIPTWFLGVNDATDVQVAVKSGASAVLTDRINWLVSYMKDNNLKFKGLDS